MNWKDFIEAEKKQEYFKKIVETLQTEAKSHIIYPPHQDVFKAFSYCPYELTRCVILGQDVYHNPGQAHGLAFSVKPGVKTPPSLQNIFKELKLDLGIDPPNHGCLIDWAKQGILLLNSALTVRQNEPGSHAKIGWQLFTDKVISILNDKPEPIVFILWGAFARQKKELIANSHHLILEAPHPSPFSAHSGFFGSKPFSQTNNFLIKNNLDPINWKIND